MLSILRQSALPHISRSRIRCLPTELRRSSSLLVSIRSPVLMPSSSSCVSPSAQMSFPTSTKRLGAPRLPSSFPPTSPPPKVVPTVFAGVGGVTSTVAVCAIIWVCWKVIVTPIVIILTLVITSFLGLAIILPSLILLAGPSEQERRASEPRKARKDTEKRYREFVYRTKLPRKTKRILRKVDSAMSLFCHDELRAEQRS
ncbi:uncharacterized protein LY89DRAFT_209154 [Mollisia scopiformis]|uniref:Transmembrane protein n=1 Tax=Mollisia scopiformis TaxID=149040 RepID=A0A194WY28_MOLSC|nr:uncharacterized protein LY89DRAFT_209154 [Mollisia scopiformis]KUJ12502.1 hypothetical protein LY89DRAFT_209154 [Mollisia scopiformis]